MKKWISFVCLGLLFLSGTAFAEDETAELRRIIEEQNQRISDLMSRIETIESAQDNQAEWIEQKDKPIWTDTIKVSGDFRYRHELIDEEDLDNRNRHRIRARIGVGATLSDEVDLGFQLATSEASGRNSEGDPVSNNQTLTNAFSFKEIWLSQAYADYHPAAVPGFRLIGGKMPYPFITAGKSELIFDGDLAPEGGAVKYAKKFDSIEALANLYGFWVLERSADADSGLLGAQGALKYNFTAFEDKAHVLGGVGYFDYGNIEGEKPFFDKDGKSFGNTLVRGVFPDDFNLFNAFGEVGVTVKKIPVYIFTDFVTNEAVSKENDGWLVGFGVGKTKDPGSWEFRYYYRELEKDAVVGGFADSDFGGGGTNNKGHEVNLGYQLTKNWKLAASYFNNDKKIAGGEDETGYHRLQLDAEFKF
ncbi:putative porin [Candidatus Poribacteria bacterium]|nr:putative porin [Candidatus Poribacteria bacterium]